MLKKINLGLVALVLGFGLIFTTSAFTSRFTTQWAYQPNSANDPTDYTKYNHVSTPSDLCAPGSLPCVITVPTDVDTPAELQTFLAGKTPAQILAISTGRSPEQ